MYFARLGDDELLIAALRWPVDQGPLLSPGWLAVLAGVRDIDLALRLHITPQAKSAVLLLNAPAKRVSDLRRIVQALLEAHDRPEVLQSPASRAEFDSIAEALQPEQRRLQHEDITIRGHAWGEVGRLWPVVQASHGLADIIWQINLRRWTPEPATLRQVKQRTYWWHAESDFPAHTARSQAEQLSALEAPGWIGCEMLACNSTKDTCSWETAILGKLPTARIVRDEALDWYLPYALHPWGYNEAAFSLEALAASCWSPGDLEKLGKFQFQAKRKPKFTKEDIDLLLYKKRNLGEIADAAAQAALSRYLTKLNAEQAIERDKLEGQISYIAALGAAPIEVLVTLAKDPNNAKLLVEIVQHETFTKMSPEQIQAVKTGLAPQSGLNSQQMMDMLMRMHSDTIKGMTTMGGHISEAAVGVAQATSGRGNTQPAKPSCPKCRSPINSPLPRFCIHCGQSLSHL